MRIGELRCALPVRHAVETMRPLPVRPLANVPSFVRGVSVVRGEPLPVVDLGQLLIGTAPTAPGRFVVVKSGGRKVALAVEAVEGIHRVTGQSFESVPPLLSGAPADAIAALGRLDRELLLILETTCLLPQEVWPSVVGLEKL